MAYYLQNYLKIIKSMVKPLSQTLAVLPTATFFYTKFDQLGKY